jgi:glycine/D-amino acid oxidase-like deaminating enzyme
MLSGFPPGDRTRIRTSWSLARYGHAHWGLTLGPVTGRLIAEMMTGATPFVDPAPYAAERFG